MINDNVEKQVSIFTNIIWQKRDLKMLSWIMYLPCMDGRTLLTNGVSTQFSQLPFISALQLI